MIRLATKKYLDLNPNILIANLSQVEKINYCSCDLKRHSIQELEINALSQSFALDYHLPYQISTKKPGNIDAYFFPNVLILIIAIFVRIPKLRLSIFRFFRGQVAFMVILIFFSI